MLRIRFSRTGKKGQPSFRIVVAEHTAPIKGRNTEIVGHYLPALTPKVVEFNKERIEYWIAHGAQPTDSVAALLKKNGVEGMDKYLEPRDKKRKSSKEPEPEAAPAPKPAAPAAAPAPVETPAEEAPAPAAEPEAPVEEAKAEEAPVEATPVEEAPKAEAEAPAEEEAPSEEEKPSEGAAA
ncbi:30S ribosomal protein S16 [Candidatus Peregrinibacteria bacterium CG_4_9_14_0_2_um_filter_53_11]|nr:MAG: 30S ribosomal protein S16 [Candidatus Peregrinibacteria bacterium CG_4_9_14_0_2_um_filter_53_11]